MDRNSAGAGEGHVEPLVYATVQRTSSRFSISALAVLLAGILVGPLSVGALIAPCLVDRYAHFSFPMFWTTLAFVDLLIGSLSLHSLSPAVYGRTLAMTGILIASIWNFAFLIIWYVFR